MMLIRGDARLLPLTDNCVDCVVTSPPYFGLRDYGTSTQIGLEDTPDRYIDAMCLALREIRRVLKASGTVWLNLGDSYGSGTTGRRDELPEYLAWIWRIRISRVNGPRNVAYVSRRRSPHDAAPH